ncbi:MAG: hypothetical protein ACT4O3_05860 [Elusimicrobiota bacterium]|jgi:hypothetical protein
MSLSFRRCLSAVLIPAVTLVCLPRSGAAAVLPHAASPEISAPADAPDGALRTRVQGKLIKAGLTEAQAESLSKDLDQRELARLEQADLTQAAGDGLGTVLVVLAIIALAIFIVKNLD